jgi:metal-responsive CopG/Arc/MetJ family transcriptional regulator
VRVKTSVTLPGDLLTEIDRADPNRSGFLEKAARRYLGQMEKERRDARDAAILDSRAEHLNREASDVLEYQNLD